MEQQNTDDKSKKRIEVIKKLEQIESNLPMIEHPRNGRIISDFATELSTELKEKKIIFLQETTNSVVRILETSNTSSIIDLNSKAFIGIIEANLNPYIFTKKEGVVVKTIKSVEEKITKIVLELDVFKNSLDVIKQKLDVPLPIIYKNKLTFVKHGYDERFNSWLSPNSPKISNPNMTLEEANEIFNEMLEGFCFTDSQDRVNAIAGFITPFIKGLSKREDKIYDFKSPLLIYQANRSRAGKDYLAGITGVIYEGNSVTEHPITEQSEEEFSKKIITALLSGKKIYHSGNNKGELNNSVFESAITSNIVSGRKLGGNIQVQLDNFMEYSISANIGFIYTPDIENRAIKIGLFFATEDENSRTFKHINLYDWILERRGDVLSAIYTLIRIWDEKGRPKGSLPFTSFPEWAEICGGIMESCDLGNPCVKYDREDEGGDDMTKDMKILFEEMYDVFGDKYVTLQDIATKRDELKIEAFLELNLYDVIQKRKFFKTISKFIGRELSGILLTVDDKSKKPHRRKLKFSKI